LSYTHTLAPQPSFPHSKAHSATAPPSNSILSFMPLV
jgi:hypothetical protein